MCMCVYTLRAYLLLMSPRSPMAQGAKIELQQFFSFWSSSPKSPRRAWSICVTILSCCSANFEFAFVTARDNRFPRTSRTPLFDDQGKWPKRESPEERRSDPSTPLGSEIEAISEALDKKLRSETSRSMLEAKQGSKDDGEICLADSIIIKIGRI